MKYKAKRKMVEARQSIKNGDWESGDKQITAARKIDHSPGLSYGELRALANLRRLRTKALNWLGRLISSNAREQS